jgi:glucokinase
MLSVGIDIGGTKILGALVDEHGQILFEAKVPSPAQDPDLMVSTVVDLIKEVSSHATSPVVCAGVAAAGFIDANQSTILYAPNLNWRNEPFRDRLQVHLDIPLVIENDANAAGWAEYKFGAGRGTKDMVMLTLGTGVGGAVVADYKLRRGGFGIAGELGHVRVVQDGKQCGCGRKGCVEQYSSGTAVVKAAKKLAAGSGPAGQRLRELKEESGELSGAQVYQALLEGDAGVYSIFREAGRYLGQAMATITAVLDPQVYVIGGGLSDAGELILEPIREGFLQDLPARGFRPEAKIVTAEFTNQAGVIGAADLARESLAKL